MPDNALNMKLARVRPPIETSATLPPACYSDEQVFEDEGRHVFGSTWVAVGRRDRWVEKGSFITVELGDTSLIVIVDGDGTLHALANVCRHRGARLLSGEGQCRTIRCPFHRWTYALDGQLLTAPRMNDCESFDATQYALHAARVETMGGFVFICLDVNAPDLSEVMGDFEAVHRPWCLNELVSTRRREFDVNCNWKGFLEVFNEYYHLPYVHPNSLANLYADPDSPTEVSGAYASQFGDTQGTGALLEHQQAQGLPTMSSLEGRNRAGVRYTWVFPNLTFAAGTDAVWVYETYPVTPRRTHVVMTACFAPETVASSDFEKQVEHYYKRLDDAIEEDIPALENQQAGLNSPLAKQGRYCALLEPNVANFAFWYAAKMRAG